MVEVLSEKRLIMCECCGKEEVMQAYPGASICETCDRLLDQAARYATEHDLDQSKLTGWTR